MPTIRQVYENPLTTTKNVKVLAERANVKIESARRFLKNEASVQIVKQYTKPTDLKFYSPTGANKNEWQSDVMYLTDFLGKNNKRMAILTVLNTTTRVAFARGLLNTKSKTLAHELNDIINEIHKHDMKISVLREDGGSEYKSDVRVLLKSLGIKLENVEPNTHYRLARTDRFHRT